MKNFTSFNSFFLYVFIICIAALGEAFAVKLSATEVTATGGQRKACTQETTVLQSINLTPLTYDERNNPVVSESDSVDFDVEVVQPRKFLLSFTKKREETFFIKIYDVIGNLIHHEVVSKTGKFRKHYDLSKYKTDLYVIEVGSSKKAKIKRLFLG
jgi:hypothetical protein